MSQENIIERKRRELEEYDWATCEYCHRDFPTSELDICPECGMILCEKCWYLHK